MRLMRLLPCPLHYHEPTRRFFQRHDRLFGPPALADVFAGYFQCLFIGFASVSEAAKPLADMGV